MIGFDVLRVARICHGTLEGAGENAPIRRVIIDSREAGPGDLFVALPGRNTHGAAFVRDAFRRGAVAAIVEPGAPELDEEFADRALIRVKYPRKALGDVARAHRATLRCPVIGITGSNGKSSTREILAGALSSLGEVVRSPQSFNNDLGVPLTILSAGPDTAALIVEMGTSGRGEIRNLCGIAKPDMGIVTNVASAHLDGLANLEGVAWEKGALAEALPEGGLLVLNAEDEHALAMAPRSDARVVTFGLGEGKATVWGCDVGRTARGTTVWLYGKMRMFLPVVGAHNARNAMAAAAVALSLGVDPEEIRQGLRTVKLPGMRLERRRIGGVATLLDCYNANPASLEAAVEELDARANGRRRILVLGDMLELGPRSELFHAEAGRRVASRVDVLWCIGPHARAAFDGAMATRLHPEQVFWSPDVETAMRDPAVEFADDDYVLFKASRGVALERVADGLLKGRRRRLAAAERAHSEMAQSESAQAESAQAEGAQAEGAEPERVEAEQTDRERVS